MAEDRSLREFISAEIARAQVDVQAARADAKHWQRAAEHLDAELKQQARNGADVKRANRVRQSRHRRRHQWWHPVAEPPT